MCYFSNTEEEEDTCGLQVDWLSGKLCRKRLLLIRILESGVVCWVYQAGYREKTHTRQNRHLKVHVYFKQSEQNTVWGKGW